MNECLRFCASLMVAVCATLVGCSLAMALQNEEPQTNESWTRLAEAGFDLEELDGLRRRNSQPLKGEDREPMESLLAIVDRWDGNGFESIRPLGLLELLADTQNSVCRRVQMTGNVRQCLRIKDGGEVDAANTACLLYTSDAADE